MHRFGKSFNFTSPFWTKSHRQWYCWGPACLPWFHLSCPLVLCHLYFPSHPPSLHSEKLTIINCDAWLSPVDQQCQLPSSHSPQPRTLRQKGQRSDRHTRCGGHPPTHPPNMLPIPTRCDSIRCPSKSQINRRLLCVTHRSAYQTKPKCVCVRGGVWDRVQWEKDGWVVAFFPPLNATCHQGARHRVHHFLPLWSECLLSLVSAAFRGQWKLPSPITEKEMWTSSLLFTCELV